MDAGEKAKQALARVELVEHLFMTSSMHELYETPRPYPIVISRLAITYAEYAAGEVVFSVGDAEIGRWVAAVLHAAWPFGYPLNPPITLGVNDRLLVKWEKSRGGSVVFYTCQLRPPRP